MGANRDQDRRSSLWRSVQRSSDRGAVRPTVKGPWTILEDVILRQTMTGSDCVNCDGSARGSTRRLPARIRGTAVLPLLLAPAVFRKVLKTWWRREDSNLRHGAYET